MNITYPLIPAPVTAAADHLIRVFASCGFLIEAAQVFNNATKPLQCTWNAFIDAHSKLGDCYIALQLFDRMQTEGTDPDKFSFPRILKACSRSGAIGQGRRIHEQIVGLKRDVVIESTLIDMYAKCGYLDEARGVFDRLEDQDVVSWGAMIAGYTQHGEGFLALECFNRMQHQGIRPNKVIFSCVLKACGNMGAIDQGIHICRHILDTGLQYDIIVGSTLVDMYAKWGNLEDAHRIFDSLPHRDIVTWGSMITGYAQHNKGHFALSCFGNMLQEGVSPNKIIYSSMLKACGSTCELEQGKCIHEQLIEKGFHFDTVLGNTLVDMYVRCGNLEEAHQVFDKLADRDVMSWGTMIAGYVHNGKGHLALGCFEDMQLSGIMPDRFMFPSILKACTSIGSIEQGRRIHELSIENKFQHDMILGTAIVDLYAKCGSLPEALSNFDKFHKHNVSSWNVLITGCAQHGEATTVIDYFRIMLQEGIEPDKFTFPSILKACSTCGTIEQGRYIHGHILDKGFQSDFIVGHTIVDMYAKCGSLDEAHIVFDNLPCKDIGAWSAMIAGCVESGDSDLAFECFMDMHLDGLIPEKLTFLNMLKSCSSVHATIQGRYIHQQIIANGVEYDMILGNTLVNMYAKCGSLEEAGIIFEGLSNRSVVTWGAMIAGYAYHEEYVLALECFDNMQHAGIEPNKIVFSIILKVCGTLGAIDQGENIHEQLNETELQFDAVLGNTLIDMYAKCGNLEMACKIFDKLAYHDAISWGAIIAGYAEHGDARLAMLYFEDMYHTGIQPDAVTFNAILTAFSRAGLVDEGLWCLKTMREDHGIKPNLRHVTCVVDLLGRAGYFVEARDLTMKTEQHDICLWKALFNACKMYGNLHLGQECFEKNFCLDASCGSAYILMSNMYCTNSQVFL